MINNPRNYVKSSILDAKIAHFNWQPYWLLLEKKGCRRLSYRPISNFHNSVTTVSSQENSRTCHETYPPASRELPEVISTPYPENCVVTQGRYDQQNQRKSANKLYKITQKLKISGNLTIVNIFLYIYTVDILTLHKNQHQFPVSTTRQQHHTSQPPARQPANQLLTLPLCHTHIMTARSVVV